MLPTILRRSSGVILVCVCVCGFVFYYGAFVSSLALFFVHFDHLAWGREGWSVYLVLLFVYFVRDKLAATCSCGTPWTFLLTFLSTSVPSSTAMSFIKLVPTIRLYYYMTSLHIKTKPIVSFNFYSSNVSRIANKIILSRRKWQKYKAIKLV